MAGTKLPAAPSAAERQSALKPGCRRARLAADRQRTQRKHTSTKTAERITLRKLKVDFLILALMRRRPGPRHRRQKRTSIWATSRREVGSSGWSLTASTRLTARRGESRPRARGL